MTETKKRRPRSPAVPSRQLRDCVGDTKKLYAQYGHGSFTRSEIASTMTLSSGSGYFAQCLFTLKEYGLIESDGEKFKVSQTYHDLANNQPSSARFKKSALQAIGRSSVFTGLLDEFKTKLPDIAGIAQRLEIEKSFNKDRAREVASVLDQSLRYAGVLDQSGNILPVRDDDTHDDSLGDAAGDDSYSDDPRPPEGMLRSEVPLSDGRKAVVVYPHDLTGAEAAKVGKVLGALVS